MEPAALFVIQFILAHMIGDYVLQNHWMATQKTTRSWPALVHVTLYTLPFWLFFGPSWALAVIGGTHFVIDRWRLARLWVRFWGVGCNGWLPSRVVAIRHPLVPMPDGSFNTQSPPEPAPPFLAVWLLIIVDNVMHVAINAAALHWLG